MHGSKINNGNNILSELINGLTMNCYQEKIKQKTKFCN